MYKVKGTITAKPRWKTYAAAKRNVKKLRKNSRVKNVRVVRV